MVNIANIANIEHGERSLRGMREVRFVFMLTEEEDAAINAFRFANHIGTKAEAARTLIREGLKTKTATTEPARAE